MAALHTNTTLDPEAEMTAFVEKLEREALDEDQIIGALNRCIELLGSRRQAANDTIRAELVARIVDNRRALVKAGVKGVKPIPLGGPVIQPASVIPTRH